MDLNIKSRLTWVNLFLETNNAGHVCIRCGISRPTFRKWVNRYNKLGIDGLADQSKHPKNSLKIKLTTEIENRILYLRKKHNLVVSRIHTELIRLYDIRLSSNTLKFLDKMHLNGKVERSQKTDLEGFYATIDMSNFEKLKEECSQYSCTNISRCLQHNIG